jgi:hypothetical protein
MGRIEVSFANVVSLCRPVDGIIVLDVEFLWDNINIHRNIGS